MRFIDTIEAAVCTISMTERRGGDGWNVDFAPATLDHEFDLCRAYTLSRILKRSVLHTLISEHCTVIQMA